MWLNRHVSRNGEEGRQDMETGSHDPARVVCVEGHVGCLEHTSMPRRRTEADNMAMRGEVPPGWVRLPGGGIVPPALAARSDRGWEADADRDSAMAARLAEYVRDMDASVAAWLADPSATVEEAERIMGIWQDIRKITRGEGGR